MIGSPSLSNRLITQASTSQSSLQSSPPATSATRTRNGCQDVILEYRGGRGAASGSGGKPTVEIAALIVSAFAALGSGVAVWYARRSANAAASSATTQRDALELERSKIARADAPEFSLTPCRTFGGALMPWTVEVRLTSGPNLASVVARLPAGVDVNAVHGLTRTRDGAPQREVELGPVARGRDQYVWITVADQAVMRVPLELHCTEDTLEGRQWPVFATYERPESLATSGCAPLAGRSARSSIGPETTSQSPAKDRLRYTSE